MAGCTGAEGRSTTTERGDALESLDWQIAGRKALEVPPDPDIDVGRAGDEKGEFDVVVRGERGRMTAEDSARAAAAKPRADGEADPAEAERWRERLLLADDEDIAAPPGQVHVWVSLRDRPFPWREFRNVALTDEDRQALVAAREKDLAPELDRLELRLAEIGGEAMARHWLAPMVDALVPESALAELATWRDIERAGRTERGHLAGPYHTGLETRDRTGATRLIQAGYDGSKGNRGTTARVRVGIVDGEPQPFHYGFLEQAGGSWSTRIEKMRYCDPFGCTNAPYNNPGPANPANGGNHATAVTQFAVGSIEAGQDPNYGSTTERRQRSGLAPKTGIYQYWAAYSFNVRILEDALADGTVDILNHSWGSYDGSGCYRNSEMNGFNPALRNITDAGVLNLLTMGDAGHGGGCSAIWPANRPDGVAVGALDGRDANVAYAATSTSIHTARGGAPLTVDGSTYSTALSVADLATIGTTDWMYNYTNGGLGSPSYYQWDSGEDGYTSYSTPIVSGQAALLRHAMVAQGVYALATDARLQIPFLIMMGDGWPGTGSGRTTSGMSWTTGAGRSYNHLMSSSHFSPGWGYSCHKGTLSDGDTVTYSVRPNLGGGALPMQASVKTWKAVLTWDEADLANAADLDLEVFDQCPGQPATYLAGDNGRDLRERLRLTSVAGKCLRARVSAYHIPMVWIPYLHIWVPGTRTYTMCHYYQSNNTTEH